jgi:hypothetical protein
MRAWRTEAFDIVCIVSAETRGAARYLTWRSANDAGFGAEFGDIHVVRSPEHDAWADVNHRRVVTPEYAQEPPNA